MCTVSFVATPDKIIITSNRDEAVMRPALPPQAYIINNKNVIFPKDPKAGGTWYAVDENGTVLVLLNGADEKHQHRPPYSRSRGLVVLELIGNVSAIAYWDGIDLEGVEPFTIVLFQAGKLYQLRWNGKQKDRLDLDPSEHHIWSSTTLYPKGIREQREDWFKHFMDMKQQVNELDLLHFHRYTENSNTENGLIINRNDALKTLTITQAVLQEQVLRMTHHDLIEQTESINAFAIKSASL